MENISKKAEKIISLYRQASKLQSGILDYIAENIDGNSKLDGDKDELESTASSLAMILQKYIGLVIAADIEQA